MGWSEFSFFILFSSSLPSPVLDLNTLTLFEGLS